MTRDTIQNMINKYAECVIYIGRPNSVTTPPAGEYMVLQASAAVEPNTYS